jgi:hypothetical protein
MERTDWLDVGFTPADARFLMATAITHHRVSSPIWGEREVRKLHAELADIQRLGARIVAEESAAFSGRRPFARRRTEAGGKAA